MNWSNLLSPTRLCRPQGDLDFRSPFQRDFDRIVFSSALRRLQDKTQVFPLAKNDYVRTRLTHSLEVSSVGRSLGNSISEELAARYPGDFTRTRPYWVGEAVAAGCLAHDIGNPPFGHSGEDAISAWFEDPKNSWSLEGLSPNQKAEFQRFEGNAQGFRVLCTLQRHNRGARQYGGLQLTHATLGSFLKYPRQAHVSTLNPDRISHKKFNFFETEKHHFLEIVNALGLECTVEDEAWCRHPLVFLVEAADDISYTIADLQDGLRMGQLEFGMIRELLLEVLGERAKEVEEEIRYFRDPKDKIEHMAGKAIGTLVQEISGEFLNREGEMLEGRFDQPLCSVVPAKDVLKRMFDLNHEKVYTCKEVVHLKLAGFAVVQGLLDMFVPALLGRGGELKASQGLNRLVGKLIPSQFLDDEGQPPDSNYDRLHCITDFLSGMTDSYAVSLYRKLNGISID